MRCITRAGKLLPLRSMRFGVATETTEDRSISCEGVPTAEWRCPVRFVAPKVTKYALDDMGLTCGQSAERARNPPLSSKTKTPLVRRNPSSAASVTLIKPFEA